MQNKNYFTTSSKKTSKILVHLSDYHATIFHEFQKELSKPFKRLLSKKQVFETVLDVIKDHSSLMISNLSMTIATEVKNKPKRTYKIKIGKHKVDEKLIKKL